jgi:hypothetical protein
MKGKFKSRIPNGLFMFYKACRNVHTAISNARSALYDAETAIENGYPAISDMYPAQNIKKN